MLDERGINVWIATPCKKRRARNDIINYIGGLGVSATGALLLLLVSVCGEAAIALLLTGAS